jgi:hypothetical protein
VPELLSKVSSRELSEWMAYDALEGLPDRRQEILLASLLAMTVNINRDPKKGEPATALDFLPWMRQDEDDEEPEPVDMVKRIEMLNALFGGEDRRGRSAESDGLDG